ncbi:MAG: TRAP transporter substrate-binding protein DctP, partial [Pseudomonadota bacterium]
MTGAVVGTALLMGLGVPSWTATAAETYTMKIGTPTINDTQHEWMKRFKARIEKRSGGRVKAQLFPASQLGKIPRMIEGMQLGTIESVVAPAAFLVGVDKRNSVLSVPGLFQNVDHCWRTFGDPAFR